MTDNKKLILRLRKAHYRSLLLRVVSTHTA